MTELENIINLLIDSKIIKSTCFMCFKQDNIRNMLNIYENNVHIEGLKVETFSLATLMKKVFPLEDIVFSQACQSCTDMLLNTYTYLNRKKYIEQSISLLIKNISKQLFASSALQGNLYIEAELPKKDIQNTAPNFFKDIQNSNNLFNEEISSNCTKILKHKDIKHSFKSFKERKSWKSYSCDNCQYITKSKSTLEGHINKKHLNRRPYVCSCSKQFYRKNALVEHIKTHTHNKDCICEICGDTFYYKKSLYNHLKLHTNEKMFECLVCNQRFVNRSRVNYHMKRKHGEKREICLICGKKFVLKKEIKRHMKLVHKDSILDNLFDFQGMFEPPI